MSSEPNFAGAIGDTYHDSTPWWPDPNPSAGRPNVVFVVLDDVGFADLGCYGSEIDTPAMDSLAGGGVAFNNFHTTAICSPTRASLLTGRNPHSVGIGTVVEMSAGSSGYPGYRGSISPRAATVAEVLRDAGYSTVASGKWHVMPQEEATAAGPFHGWPLQKGFDRWLGFHGGLADQWHPELFEDNHAIETPVREGYHLSDHLVDFSVQAIRDLRVASPDRPFFLYLAFGAAHFPHQVPRGYVEKYRGRYDRGWDAVRRDRFERQKTLGVVPENTDLPPMNPGVKPWDDLSQDERTLFARMMEVYAGFMDHTDVQIGRFIDFLRASGEYDNTIIVLLSDNGASADGGVSGAVNARKTLDYEADSIERSLQFLDELGGPNTYPHYPTGWAQASNTPLRWYKKQVHGGGIRGPLVVHAPGASSLAGTILNQYHHVADIVPTVLELVGVELPESVGGVEQIPLEGTSFAYALTPDGVALPTRKRIQYFEQLGGRALWYNGWKAVTRHYEGDSFDNDEWELYNVADDFSEAHDLAANEPDKLEELISAWWEEARKHSVLPLDDRQYARKALGIALRARRVNRYFPGMSRIDRFHTPDMSDRSYRIRARLDGVDGDTSGVVLSIGSRFGGCVLYVRKGYPVFEYSYDGFERTVLESSVRLPAGACELTLEFTRTGSRQGDARLLVDDECVVRVHLDKTWPVAGLAGGLHCGRDGASPVSEAYDGPYPFSATIHEVLVELDLAHDSDAGASAARAALFEE